MRIFENRALGKYLLIIAAAIIAIGSVLVSNSLVKDLQEEEKKKIEIWAEATKELVSPKEEMSLDLIMSIVESNTTIPVILYDKVNDSYSSTNMDLPETNVKEFLKKKSIDFVDKHEPIVIQTSGIEQYVYYDDSYILKRLQWYPYVQLTVMAVFMIVSLLAVLSTKRMEQDRVWVGLSKETAHQLGTPLSSLLAWIEYIRLKNQDAQLVDNMEKDVNRLQMVADRFSKIGSKEVLEPADLSDIVTQTMNYLRTRTSSKVNIEIDLPNAPLYANVNAPLISWVIENMIKNSVDAMEGMGNVSLKLWEENEKIVCTISDTGKGIPKSKFKTVFKPGYTSKERGWGLGLSLAKRIIKSYHKGKIFVEVSQLGVGTVFRIELMKVQS